MNRFIRLVLWAIALTLGLVLADRMLGLRGERRTSQQDAGAVPRDTVDESHAAEAGRARALQNEEKPGAVPRTLKQELQAETVAGPTTLPARNQQQNSATPTSINQNEAPRVEVGVVGRRFPISDSIRAACEGEKSYQQDFCDTAAALVAQTSNEPREEPWATHAEKAIRDLVEQEPGKFAIRGLECRTSVCFVETASIFGGLHRRLYDFEKQSGLRAEYAVDSREIDESGAAVHVTLWPFVRR